MSMSFTKDSALARLQRLRDLLHVATLTVDQAAERTHISERWARQYLQHLIDTGDAHVCGYAMEPGGVRRYPRPIYANGPGQCAERPKPLTRTQINHRRKARERNDAEAWLNQIGKRRARTFIPRPDIAAAWLTAQ